MIRTVVLAFSLTGGVLCSADLLQGRQGATPATLDLHISAKATSLTLGQQPQITATITNKGKAPVTLVLPGDGSESGWRTPLVGFSSIKIDKGKPKHPATVPLYRGGRCGNVNALKSNEVFSLAPGKSQDLSGCIGSPRFTEPRHLQRGFLVFQRPRTEVAGNPLGQA